MADRPAILKGTPIRAGKSWPSWPYWDEAEREAVARVLESGTWSNAKGPEVDLWVEEFAAFQDAPHGLGLTNGTHTLETALAACGVGEGDEVIVPGLTFVSSATSALAVNAIPILVDIDPETLCIDVAAAEAAVTERTRAIVAVHLAGSACDLDALGRLCAARGLALIEDCAHAHGTRWRGKGVGSFGSFGSFSFQESKLMTAGEGGALLTGDEDLRARAWSYANCGRVEGGHWFDHVNYGTNMRMTEWQGAVLRAQLKRLPEHNRIREERARLLDSELEKIPGLKPQAGDSRMDSRARFSYVFGYDPAEFSGLSLAGFELALAHEGFALGTSYPAVNTLRVFREGRFGERLRSLAPQVDYAALRLPHAEAAAAGTVWVDQRVLLADPDDVLDLPRAIERIRSHARSVRARTSQPVRFGGQVVRGARRRLSSSG